MNSFFKLICNGCKKNSGHIGDRWPYNDGTDDHVVHKTLNISEAYKDERFDPKVDEGSDFVTRSILCMPIKNVNGKVIGVSQLVNKMDGSAFNKNDENLFEAFAIFCGMGINNTQMYETAVRAVAKQRVALEVMSYHAIAPEEDAVKLKKVKIPSAQHYNLLDYKFCDFHLDDDNTLKATIRMFMDLNLLKNFSIDYEIFCRWMLSVKKNYRNVTYHNWRHAFNVTQTMYCMLKAGQMNNILTDVECLALMVGCLCHDLDHRGTNNQFQQKTMSPLAELYGTSTMEHHHFDQCIMILSTKGSDIFRNLSHESYDQVLLLLEKAILSTDLALYFRHRGKFFQLVKSGNSIWHDDENRNLLRSMMMTASDVAAISKPWEIQKKVASLVASEFFEQGDLEKETLHLKPSAMMDREQADKLPDLQVGFIDDICMPVYEAISLVSSRLSPLLEGCKQNRENWLMQARAVNKRMEEKRAEVADKDKKEEKREADKKEIDRENKKQQEEEEEEEELEEDEDTVVENVNIRLIPFHDKDGGDENGTKKETKSKSWRSTSFGGIGKKDKSNEEKIRLVKLGEPPQESKNIEEERSKQAEGRGGEGPCIPSTSSASSSPSMSKYFRIGRGGSEKKTHSSKRRGFACQGRSRGTDDEDHHSGSGDRSGGQS
ncbi:phosphodiesterase [Elysia marginata]|uniref:Phosphodiesterase n=1 Tax=Elysia marginata TaxID=1093978 RepID=A0AAV4F070_9GAST|nr:phosphodiesterase [Elysia marginata]